MNLYQLTGFPEQYQAPKGDIPVTIYSDWFGAEIPATLHPVPASVAYRPLEVGDIIQRGDLSLLKDSGEGFHGFHPIHESAIGMPHEPNQVHKALFRPVPVPADESSHLRKALEEIHALMVNAYGNSSFHPRVREIARAALETQEPVPAAVEGAVPISAGCMDRTCDEPGKSVTGKVVNTASQAGLNDASRSATNAQGADAIRMRQCCFAGENPALSNLLKPEPPDERARFEADWQSRHPWPEFPRNKLYPDRYLFCEMQEAWLSWQARAALK